MSVYNDQATIGTAIQSILDQTYTNFEFIIINDGSSDQSLSIINRFRDRESRIQVITQENSGLTVALNTAIAQAKGTYIARIDADDISDVTRLEKQVKFLEENSDILVCGSMGYLIDMEGTIIGKKILPISPEQVYQKLLFNNQCIHSSLMIRASAIDTYGPYDPSFRTSQDYELLLRLASYGKVANINEALVLWRVRSGSISWSSKRQEIDAIRARWKAIRSYHYPFLKGFFHILIRSVWLMIPQGLKRKRYA